MSDSFATPWTVACQTPLLWGFHRQEYWSWLPFLCPGHLPDPISCIGRWNLDHWSGKPDLQLSRYFLSLALRPSENTGDTALVQQVAREGVWLIPSVSSLDIKSLQRWKTNNHHFIGSFELLPFPLMLIQICKWVCKPSYWNWNSPRSDHIFLLFS